MANQIRGDLRSERACPNPQPAQSKGGLGHRVVTVLTGIAALIKSAYRAIMGSSPKSPGASAPVRPSQPAPVQPVPPIQPARVQPIQPAQVQPIESALFTQSDYIYAQEVIRLLDKGENNEALTTMAKFTPATNKKWEEFFRVYRTARLQKTPQLGALPLKLQYEGMREFCANGSNSYQQKPGIPLPRRFRVGAGYGAPRIDYYTNR